MNFKTLEINELIEIKTVTSTEAEAIKGGKSRTRTVTVEGPKGKSATKTRTPIDRLLIVSS